LLIKPCPDLSRTGLFLRPAGEPTPAYYLQGQAPDYDIRGQAGLFYLANNYFVEKIVSNFVFWLKNAEDFPKIQKNYVVSTIDKFLGGRYNCFNLSKSANVDLLSEWRIKMSNNAHIERFYRIERFLLRKNGVFSGGQKMKKAFVIFTYISLMLHFTTQEAYGDAVFGEQFDLRQPNGKIVQVRIWGDEFYRVVESLDGYTLTQDEKSGFICYANTSPDGNDLVSTGIRAETGQAKHFGLKQHARIRKDAAKAKIQAARSKVASIELETKAALGFSPEITYAPNNGVVRGICLIVDFPDQPGTITPGEVSNFCNQIGYNNSGNNGSICDYFFDVSDGYLTYTNFVPNVYYRASHNKSYYDNPNEAAGPKARELILEALNNLNNNGFDFSQYDSDGDGLIDAINCFYAGNRASGWLMGLWPHSSTITFSADGVSAFKYQITDMSNSLTIGTFCHENGHLICYWHDLYDYDYDSEGAGRYCLMSYKASNTNPVEPCAYLKGLAGWADIIPMSGSQSGLQVTAGLNTFYKFEYAGFPNEYIIVENRQKTGRDTAIPDAGIAIWHIDTIGSNNNQQMTASQHYEATLEQADGNWDLENDRNQGDTTDLWKSPSYTTFGPFSSPASDWWDGSLSGLTVRQINASGNTMTFSFITTEQNHPPALSNPLVSPVSGTESTNFEFLVDYYDPDGDPPDLIYRKVDISGTGGHAEGIMALKSGSDADGTYHYTTTLPQGSYSYIFFFSDEHGLSDITNGYNGPYVYSDSDAVINIVIQCTRISSDLRLRYSLTGSSPWTDIPITKQILDPLAVPAGSTVWFQADVASANYEYREWELLENGSRIGGGTGSLWWFTLGTNTSEVGLNVFYRYTPQYYTISGTVLKGDGAPVPGGVDLTLTSDEQTMSQHTDNGNWSFTGVQGGVSVTITPSASGYVFSPANLVYNNLKDNHTGIAIVAYASDNYVPTTSFVTVPATVSENSSISFSWIGIDNVTAPANLLYQYKLDGVDADWSVWSSGTSKSYDIANGAYIFWVRAKDEAGNINQAPAIYKFVVNAAPKVIAAERINNSVWASRITLEMPIGASHPTDKFILLLSHSGINDAELVPVTIYQMDDTDPCGANAIVAGQLGLTTRITQAGTGWLVTLPHIITSGQTAQYDIVWCKIKYFGWQEFQPIPLNFPNVGQKYPPNYNDWSQVDSSYLDGSLKLWRTAIKKIYFGIYHGESNASILMNISNKNGPVVGETLLRYTPGTGWDGSYGRYTLYTGTQIVPVGSNMALLWRDLQYDYFKSTDTHVQKWRHGAETFNYSGSVIGSHDGTYAEHRSVSIPTRSIGNTLWFVDADETTAAFWVLNSDCSEIIPKTTFESFTANDSSMSLESPVQIGNNVLFLWARYWYTLSYDRPREQIMYQICDLSGNIVKATVELSPALLSDGIDKEDRYGIYSVLPDKNGKVWITYNHIQSGQSTEFSYLIIGADGNTWKGPIQTTNSRNFSFCDKDGYIWAEEGGQFFVLNPDDTIAFGPRSSAYIPNQKVGEIAASVAVDGYRLYDRWTPQPVQIDVPIGANDDSMELFDLNLWANDLHPANLNLKKGDTVVWSQSGQFIGHTTIDVSSILSEGQNLLIMTQDDFLGGQVLVTFPYQLPLPQQVATPNVVGMTQSAAATTITGAGLIVGTVTQQYSNTIAAGLVISQSPVGGTTVNVGSSVNLVVSLGKPVVPNVVGMTQSAATAAITAVDTLTVGTITTQYNNTVAVGLVISQSPVGGSAVNIGSSVSLVISLGKPVVPNVVGMTQAAATTAITAVDTLTVGTVTQQYSNTVTAGLVISQSPVGGSAVNIGSSVSLVISLGKPVVPNVVGMTQAAATTAITAVDTLTVGTGYPAVQQYCDCRISYQPGSSRWNSRQYRLIRQSGYIAR